MENCFIITLNLERKLNCICRQCYESKVKYITTKKYERKVILSLSKIEERKFSCFSRQCREGKGIFLSIGNIMEGKKFYHETNLGKLSYFYLQAIL